MDVWSVLAIVLSIGVIALVGFLIPVLIQVKDLLKTVELSMDRLEKEVEPVIHNFEGITGNFEGITGVANNFVHKPAKTGPGMVDNLKHSVKANTETIKVYLPVLKKEMNRYLKALRMGLRIAVQDFKQSRKHEVTINRSDQLQAPSSLSLSEISTVKNR
jgi:uncharacterized protein YoxC